MTFREYQHAAKETAVYPPPYEVVYPALGLAGEAGEVANQVKKALRDDGGAFPDDRRETILAELGDVLWYCAALASDLDADLEDVVRANLAKLNSRKERGTLQGSGDER